MFGSWHCFILRSPLLHQLYLKTTVIPATTNAATTMIKRRDGKEKLFRCVISSVVCCASPNATLSPPCFWQWLMIGWKMKVIATEQCAIPFQNASSLLDLRMQNFLEDGGCRLSTEEWHAKRLLNLGIKSSIAILQKFQKHIVSGKNVRDGGGGFSLCYWNNKLFDSNHRGTPLLFTILHVEFQAAQTKMHCWEVEASSLGVPLQNYQLTSDLLWRRVVEKFDRWHYRELCFW